MGGAASLARTRVTPYPPQHRAGVWMQANRRFHLPGRRSGGHLRRPVLEIRQPSTCAANGRGNRAATSANQLRCLSCRRERKQENLEDQKPFCLRLAPPTEHIAPTHLEIRSRKRYSRPSTRRAPYARSFGERTAAPECIWAPQDAAPLSVLAESNGDCSRTHRERPLPRLRA
jgi:hypothetical protein